MILENLKNTAFAMLIFVGAYVANMLFSLWFNIKLLNQKFEPSRIKESALKIATFVVGLILLVTIVTAIPLFCEYVGLDLPEEYIEVFTNLAIIGITIYVSISYAKEAFDKFKAILHYEEPLDDDIIEDDFDEELELEEENKEEILSRKMSADLDENDNKVFNVRVEILGDK